MIRSLTGTVVEATDAAVVLDVNGVGYLVHTVIDGRSLSQGTNVTFHTYLSVRENALDLYGFIDQTSLEVFGLLITIPKIGPKSALQILEQADTATLIQAAKTNDAGILTKLAGIGKKTAERITLGLHEKVERLEQYGNPTNQPPIETEALDTLVALGYPLAEARRALSNIDGSLPLSDQVKQALRVL